MSSKNFLPQIVINSTEVLTQFNTGQLLVIDSKRQGGLIIWKHHHAEFAGPGAAVGGLFDLECCRVITIADLSLIYPESYEERQQAYAIRQQWLRATQKVTQNSVPLQRAMEVLTLFGEYFDQDTVGKIPNDALALLVGVLPKTIKMARRQVQMQSEQSEQLNSSAPIEQK